MSGTGIEWARPDGLYVTVGGFHIERADLLRVAEGLET